jgi:phosphatidyl-myo-inositol dimannoside synthase
MKTANRTTVARRIVGLFPELLGLGGVQEAGRQTAAALSRIAVRRGWIADFLSLNDAVSRGSFEVGRSEVHFRGYGREKMKFAASTIGGAFADRPNIVLAAHPHLAPVVAGMKAASARVRAIVMSHGVEVWQPLPWLRRRSLLRADLALGPSRDTAEKLAAVQGVAPQKIRVLPWPVSPSILEMAGRVGALPLPQSFPSGGSIRVVLTVGRWAASERYKGVEELIRSVAQLCTAFQGLNLVAVGGGDDLPRLKKLASDAGISGRVHFLEGLSREETAACYAGCEIFALPSAGEGFGLVFLEAMAFAKPVVGASCGGTVDVVQDGVNGLLVKPRDSESLAAALRQLLENDALRQQLGSRGADIVGKRYTFEIFESELERLLEQCGMDSRGVE